MQVGLDLDWCMWLAHALSTTCTRASQIVISILAQLAQNIGWSMNDWIIIDAWWVLASLVLVLLMSPVGACWGSLAGWDLRCQSAMLNTPSAALGVLHYTGPTEYKVQSGITMLQEIVHVMIGNWKAGSCWDSNLGSYMAWVTSSLPATTGQFNHHHVVLLMKFWWSC